MTIAERTQALLDVVAADRDAKCQELARQARAVRAQLLAEAHERARVRVRESFGAERSALARSVAAARARLETRRRIAAQQRERALLECAWAELPAALQRRWTDPAGRAKWIEHVLAAAGEVLPPGQWALEYARGWPTEEAQVWRERLRVRGIALALREHPGSTAGLRVVADGNAVDATLEGLLADRPAIGAQVLDALEHPRAAHPDDSPDPATPADGGADA